MKKKILNVLFLCILIMGCSQSLYVPVSSDAEQQGNLLKGRKLYVAYCSGCHNLHFPKEFNEEQWKSNLDEMQVKAKITDAEKQLILKYLTSQP